MKYIKTRDIVCNTDITIRDEHQDVWPQEKDKFDFEQYELPARFIYSDVVIVTQKTVGAHYLDMSLSHNGYKPGDGGNGGFVDLTITSDYIYGADGGSIQVRMMDNYTIALHVEGESERLQLVKVLETALTELKKNK